MKNINIGLDIHGVIDTHPKFFARMSREWQGMGHIIHIITGQAWEKAVEKVKKADVVYHKHFSILDHHREQQDTKMWKDERGWWMPDAVWNRSKADYCTREHIDIHYDDELQYAEHMPDFCTFVLVRKEAPSALELSIPSLWFNKVEKLT